MNTPNPDYKETPGGLVRATQWNLRNSFGDRIATRWARIKRLSRKRRRHQTRQELRAIDLAFQPITVVRLHNFNIADAKNIWIHHKTILRPPTL